MTDPIRVFVGYDPREAVAYHVCCESILANTKAKDISFHPLRGEMRDGYNTFTYERFLVPYYCRFAGSAIYIDGDMVVDADIEELWALRSSGHMGVKVVKHDYKTKHHTKYLGAHNADYPRKNWSSVILWDCGYYPNRILTPKFVQTAQGSFLHRFSWLDDGRIGELPSAWNHLVGEYEPRDAKLYHYTVGSPCFDGYENQEAADKWYRHLAGALNVAGQRPHFLWDHLAYVGR